MKEQTRYTPTAPPQEEREADFSEREALRREWTAPPPDTEERERAAVVIQACWRGCRLRGRLRLALAQTQSSDPGCEDELEALDLEEFVVDQASLDSGWSLDWEDLSESHVPDLEPLFVKARGSSFWAPPSVTDLRPKQAWSSDTAGDTPPPLSVRSRSPPPSALLSGLSERSEKILEEWGFRDRHTALLMLRRARKMRSRPEEIRSEEQKIRGGATELQRRPSKIHSESFLPKMSWDILKGGRVQLVTDPGRVRLTSHSCPSISLPSKTRSVFPGPKRISSAPTQKERISFRDKKLQLSSGWGSGKKRTKPGLNQD
ncbi:leucine-rich repeat and IQ domain-containing protein 1 [Periophthalmus magnuspinnatus]|uniref:leucine-rich repeat and IQ domain-containing protein 1 n=1 Tax=Periophthalmus magnuspinnatus TaxID=409849 RepID=UPI002436B327|nr:leucine-rich repeat and IQ domain-containing protein 1 [Periophthalmus magnuspinnatus]